MHVCLFDIDGTLLASGGAGKAAMEEALRREFDLPRVLDGVPYAGRTDRAIARDLFKVHSIPDSAANWQRFLLTYLGLLPEALQRHEGRVLPGVSALLQDLRGRGDVALGLLTGNVRDGARLKLSHYALFDHFAFGAFGDAHFDRNDVALEALSVLRAHLGPAKTLTEIWVIGDTPLDVRCARAIGARAVAVFASSRPLPVRSDALSPDLSRALFARSKREPLAWSPRRWYAGIWRDDRHAQRTRRSCHEAKEVSGV
jgi:phosphoglycolate phosphatase-like HAD superfamily hydrolase